MAVAVIDVVFVAAIVISRVISDAVVFLPLLLLLVFLGGKGGGEKGGRGFLFSLSSIFLKMKIRSSLSEGEGELHGG